MASKFALRVGSRSIPLVAASDKINLQQVSEFKPLQDWAKDLAKEEASLQPSNSAREQTGSPPPSSRAEGQSKFPVIVNKIEVRNVDYFGPKVGFVNLSVDAELTETGKKPPGLIFMGKCAEELKEECGITLEHDKLIDMTELAYGSDWKGVYPSAGGCDEFLRLFASTRDMEWNELQALEGRLGGLRDHGESITLSLVELKDAYKVAPDAKLLSALALFQALKADGKIA
ncbi:hypothetical protein BGX34_008533 [Mortierella sp. NVP85]|nr:hypothetical protein BGX34_008533 [Mortierella sp. NVP85]